MINRIANQIGRKKAIDDTWRTSMAAVISGDNPLARALAETQPVCAENIYRYSLAERDVVARTSQERGFFYGVFIAPVRSAVANLRVSKAQGYLESTRKSSSTIGRTLR